MENSFLEKYILLSIHPKKDRFINNPTMFNLTFAGAILYELFLQDYLKLVDDNKIQVAVRKRPHDKMLYEILTLFIQSNRIRRVRYWVSRISRRARIYKKQVLLDLSRKSVISIKKHYFLRIIPYKKYTILHPGTRDKIVEDIMSWFISGTVLNREHLYMISLLDLGILRNIFAERQQRNIARQKVKELIKDNPLTKEITRVVNALIAANRAAHAAAAG
ncbi:MAG: GPP34 family phosphoprotein [Bacteroidales bacterium]|nr:GPP34 family phosphoprotein [Bacteroidales bacterium]